MYKILLMLNVLIFPLFALAGASSPEVLFNKKPISIFSELPKWVLSVRTQVANRIGSHLTENTDALDHYMECVETAEVPGAFICCSYYQADMNDAFTRIGLFMGAGRDTQAGTMLLNNDWTLKNYKKLVAGHNMPGSVVLDFLHESTINKVALNSMEKEFQHALQNSERIKNLKKKFYFIGIAVQDTKPAEAIVSHEILHAQYSLTPKFKEIVDRFWKTDMTVAERGEITQELGKFYNTDESIVIDEFQAFVLQRGAAMDRLAAFVARFRDRLISRLEAENLTPVGIQP